VCELVEQGKDIVVVSEDYAAPVFDDFRKKYPQRFLSVGIAEQNGVAVACGLALGGKYPIVYGCAPFPLTRAVDQVKSAVAGMQLPMAILNSGIGFGVPEFGATHYNMDDIAIVRGIPGIKIVTPTDNAMSEQLADYSIAYGAPIYLRFDKNCEGQLCSDNEISFERGFRVVGKSEGLIDVVIISCGVMVWEMLTLSQLIADEGINTKVLDLYSLPFDEVGLLNEIGNLPVVTVEEHIIQGGVGSAVLEAVNVHKQRNSVTRLGVDFGNSYPSISGGREYFMKKYGLSMDQIARAVKVAVSSEKEDSYGL